MTRLRRALGPVAIAWLFCQAATMTVTPVAFWYGSAGADLLECTCLHGDHATCPMHHDLAPGSKLCFMRSAGDNNIAVLSWLLNGVGLVPAPAQAVAPISQHIQALFDITTTSLRPAPPDPPPPRA